MSKILKRASDYHMLRVEELKNIKMLLHVRETLKDNKRIVNLATEGARICGQLSIIYKQKAHGQG